MSLPNIKDFAKKALVSATAVAAFTSPLAIANDYNQNANAQTVSFAEIRVPTSDARKIGTDAVRLTAATASNDRQIIVFYGEGEAAFQQTRTGAFNAIKDGYPLAGLIVASGVPSIEFYADGQLTGTILNPEVSGLNKTIYETIKKDYEGLIRQTQLISAVTP